MPQENDCRALRFEKLLPSVEQRAGGLLRAASRRMRGAPAFDLTAAAWSACRRCDVFCAAIVTELESETVYL